MGRAMMSMLITEAGQPSPAIGSLAFTSLEVADDAPCHRQLPQASAAVSVG